MSILPHDLRLSTIASAKDALDHRDKNKHDLELEEGAAKILYQKLAFAMQLEPNKYVTDVNTHDMNPSMNESKHVYYSGMDAITMQRLRGIQDNDVDHEICMLCSCLEMVHRASSDTIAETWDLLGTELALPLLVQVLQRPFTQMKRSSGEKKLHRDVRLSVQKVTKLLAIYSLVPQAKVPMTCYSKLLPLLVKIIDTRGINRMSSQKKVRNKNAFPPAKGNSIMFGANGIRGVESGAGLYFTEASRFNTIATLTNLAASERVRMRMLSEPDLVDHIALVAHTERSDVARQCSALALMNLSNGDKEHVPELAGNELLLETLVKLSSDEVPETRRNAAVALFNVACADENTVLIACYKDGLILQVLLDLATGKHNSVHNTNANGTSQVQIHEEEAQTSAAETLFNMSCSEIIETTDRMASHYGLLESLANTLLITPNENPSVVGVPPPNLDVKTYCAATLRRMAEITHYYASPEEPNKINGSHSALLSALVIASQWTRSACITEAFAAQAKVPPNRAVMIRHHGLLKAVSNLALLTRNDNNDLTEVDRIRSTAIAAIVYLTRESSTRVIMAHHEGVMLALTENSYNSRFDRNIEISEHSLLQEDSKTSEQSYSRTTHPHPDDIKPTKKQMEQQRFIQMAMKDLVSTM
jgi:hypothetical protein